MTNPLLKKAINAHRWQLIIVGLMWLLIAVQSVRLGVTWSDFINDVQPFIMTAFFKFCITMLVLGTIVFVQKKFSFWPFEKKANIYLNSETFFFGLVGSFIIVSASIIFIIEKCFIPFYNPFGFWDPLFAEWDRLLHFGYHPHEFLMPIADAFPPFAKLLDYCYFFWYLAITLTVTYCLYCDRNFRRRMHYIWAYIITFLFAGSSMALAFSSVGPLFYGDFILNTPNPYQDLMSHLAMINERTGLNFFEHKHILINWVRNSEIIDKNSILAMPSMHNATMLFAAVYLRTVNRYVFWGACVMVVLVFLGSVYTGLHYAIDAYVAYGVVIIIWLLTGRLIKKLYPGTENTILSR